MEQMIQSAFLRLSGNDLIKGAVMAVITAVFLSASTIITQPNFDVFTIDWGSVLRSDVNIAIVAFFAYLAKNLFTDADGKLFGRI